MKIVTSLMGTFTETTLDSLLGNPTIHDLYDFYIVNPAHRDFFESYCMVMGKEFPLVSVHPTDRISGLGYVEIRFPVLETSQ